MSLENELTGNPLAADSTEDAATESSGFTAPEYYGVTTGEDGHFYNDNGERVYYWVPSGEMPVKHSSHAAGLSAGIATEDRFGRNLTVDKGGFYTEAEIKSAFNASEGMTTLSSQVSWDNYWGYLQERQGLIETGELGTGLDAWATGGQARFDFLDANGGLRKMGGLKDGGAKALSQIRGDRYRQEYLDLINGDTQTALMEKWGIPTQHQTNDGSLYRFNGSSFTKVYESEGTDLIKTVAQVGAGVAIGAALGPAIGGVLGGGKAGAVGAAGLSNAATQLALTGEIDPMSVVSSAVVGGLNPGGALVDKVGIVPDNVVGGFVQGATNSMVGEVIRTGDVSVGSALGAGLFGAGTNIVRDLFSDADQFSVESEMDRIANERAAQGLPPLSSQDLYNEALQGTMVGQSDLAGLVGEDGLLSFLPTVPTGGLNALTGGGAFDTASIFTGPDGKQYTDLELLDQGIDPADVANGLVDGFTHSAVTYENTVLGDAFDFAKDNIPGVAGIANTASDVLDAAADQQFKQTYGMTPDEAIQQYVDSGYTTAEAIDLVQRMTSYGPLDETYNFSDNPRGQSEYLGLLSGVNAAGGDDFSTGSVNLGHEYLAGDGGIMDAINIGGEQDNVASQDTAGSGSTLNLGGGSDDQQILGTLPGSDDNTIIDAIISGAIDGATTGTATGADDAVVDTTVIDGAVTGTDDAVVDGTTAVGGAGDVVGTDSVVNSGDDLTGSTATTDSVVNTDDDLPVNIDDTLGGGNNVSTDSGSTLPASEILPAAAGMLGGGGGGGGSTGGRADKATPQWGQLFGYTTLSKYQKEALTPMVDYIKQARGMLS